MQYIALNSDLAQSLLDVLEASRKEMEALRKKEAGNVPMTLKDAAKYLHVSAPTLKGYIEKREIIPSSYGSRIWVLQSELDAFIARHRAK